MNVARVSMLMQTDLVMNNVRTNSIDLLRVQDQLSSGLRIARPSDGPAEATTVMNLDHQLERFDQFLQNMGFIDDYMSSTDSAIGQTVELVGEAHSLALQDTDDAGLIANAEIINSIITQFVTVANTQSRGQYIFAGQNGTQAPFAEFGDGILFSGSLQEMQTRVSDENIIDFSFNGDSLFGALSSQVVGIVDLDPDIASDTLLADLNGALGQGIRRGAIRINDGVNPPVIVDLSNMVTVQDVIDKINADGPTGISAAIAADGTSLEINSAVGGANLTITELGSGTTAQDLGIFDNVGAGSVINGQDVDARLTSATPVTALAGGAGIDTISGLNITNSAVANVGPIDLSSATTLGDILTLLNASPIAIRADINDTGSGINIFNRLSGSQMSISENGGTTATDLGLRSLVGTTALADLNGGDGVHLAGAELAITDRTGTVHAVDISAATTIQDVINLITAGTAGAVTATLAATGNGIELTDTTGGAGNLSVTEGVANDYFYAEELGLKKSIAGNVLTGDDVNKAEPDGVFSHLLALRDAMLAHDVTEVRRIGAKLKTDETRLINFHGRVGSQMQALEQRAQRLEDNKLALQTLRSDIRDIDFAEAVTRYQNLFAALQANLTTAGQLTNTSLLDFLR
jgi:flagellar hook-associated protein 3 FlgL